MHHPTLPAPRRLVRALLPALLASGGAFAQDTGFLQPDAGPHDYNNGANWIGGDINGVWDDSLTLAASQTVTFDSDTELTSGLVFEYTGGVNLTLRADGVANRTLTLGGDLLHNTVSANRTVTIGSNTANQMLDIDLGGASRTFDVRATAGNNSQRSLTISNNISNGSLILQGGGNVNLSAGSATSTASLDSLTLKNTHLNANANADLAISGALTIDGAGGINGSGNTGGSSLVSMAASSGRNHTLSAGSLVRANGGVAFFRGTNLGGDVVGTNNVANITFDTAPTAQLVGGGGAAGTTNISILPWAIGATTTSSAPTTFVTYDANGVRPLDVNTEFLNYTDGHNGAATDTDNNTRVTGNVTFTGDNTVNSLFLAASGTSVNGAGTLAVTSGAVYITSDSASSINVNLDFGSRQGVIGFIQGKGSNLTGAIAGSDGIVLYQNQPYVSTSSAGTGVTIAGNAAASTYTGDTIVLGRASVNVDGFLPNDTRTGDIYVYGQLGIGTSVTFNGLNGTGDVSKSFSGSAMFTLGDNDADGNFTGTLSNNGSTTIRKIGAGTQTFGGANTYTGGTEVDAGTLLITNTTGSGTGSGAISVASGARFGGSGSATGAVTAATGSAIIAGGDGSVGTLTLSGGLAATDGVTFAYDISGASIDVIDFAAGTLDLDGTVTFDFTSLGGVVGGNPYELFAGSGDWTSVTATFIANINGSGYELDTAYGIGGFLFDETARSLTVQFVTAIPEPSTLALLAGLGALGAVAVRRRRANA